MLRASLVMLLLWALAARGNDNLRVAYEWREMDFKYASPDQRWSAIERGEFKPANVIPFGLEVAGHRLFVTLPRWRAGVPASLGYLDLNGERMSCSGCSCHSCLRIYIITPAALCVPRSDLGSRVSNLGSHSSGNCFGGVWSRNCLINLTI